MKINRQIALQLLRDLLPMLAIIAAMAGVAHAQMPQAAAPKSTAAKAIGSNILWSTYNARGDAEIGVAVFEVGGGPRRDHDLFAEGTGAGILTPRHAGLAVLEHATGVVGILAANSGRGDGTGGTARNHTIYLYRRNGADARGFFTEYFRERVPGAPQWKISNHSYGSTSLAGWRLDPGMTPGSKVWIWYGTPGTIETHGMTAGDSKFGWYSPAARDLDTFIARHPDQIAVFSAGNHMGEGPTPGGPGIYVRKDINGVDRTFPLSGPMPPMNGGAGGFDCMEGIKTAKNVIMVGSVTPASNTQKWVRTKFSSTGPTDDGRVKPDLMAYGGYGLDVVKPVGSALDSGTSYAAPAVAGVLAQLAQIWKRTDATPMSAAMARVLLCHTAKDLGEVGPDYRYGWGLVDGGAAGALLTKRAADGKFALQERSLKNGASDTIYIKAPARAKVKVTIAWTDPGGVPPALVGDHDVPPLNDRTPMLRNDLDLTLLKITGAGDMGVAGTTRSWKLNPDSPATKAVQEGNIVDNIEQVTLTAPTYTATVKGVYMIIVKHKGTLRTVDGSISQNAVQQYSIAISNAAEYLPATRSITVQQLGTSGARAKWRPVPNATMYNVQYRAVGDVAWKSKGVSVSTQADFNSFAQGAWQVRVQARRVATLGTWSDPVAFYVGTPPMVTGMTVSNITTSSVKLHWNSIAGVTDYQVAYAIVDSEGELVSSFEFRYPVTSTITITGLPSDEFVAWFVNARVAPSAESGYAQADRVYIPNNCTSYEPANNSVNGARIMRVNEQYTGLICNSDEIDYYRIDPGYNIDDRYLQIYLHAHSMPYELRLWRRTKGQGGTLSAVANIVATFHPQDDRVIKYNSLDFHSYDYFIAVRTPQKGAIYDDFKVYSFWADTRNNKPWGTSRDAEDEPSMSMQELSQGKGRVRTGGTLQR